MALRTLLPVGVRFKGVSFRSVGVSRRVSARRGESTPTRRIVLPLGVCRAFVTAAPEDWASAPDAAIPASAPIVADANLSAELGILGIANSSPFAPCTSLCPSLSLPRLSRSSGTPIELISVQLPSVDIAAALRFVMLGPS